VSDVTLFLIGCGVTSLALGGAYVVLRERIFDLAERSVPQRLPEPVLVRDVTNQRRR
jgi:hypothetical protein